MAQLASLNPSTGDVVGTVEITSVEAIPGIVARARAAQPAWAARPIAERVAIVQAAGAVLKERVDAIAALLTAEMGKPYPEAHGETGYVAELVATEPPEIAAALAPEHFDSDRTHTTVYRDPLGVAVCISPWNFPILMPHQQILPALIAGNAVVYKPSEETPLVGQAYVDALLEVLPPHVLQIVHGDEAQGKALVSADVNLIVFTGSRAAGKHILAEASKGLKRVILELGGKDPLLVLDGADLEKAAAFAARNSFRNAGQVCVSTERIYVADDLHDRFVTALTAATASMRVGDGVAEGTQIGPMINPRQRAHVVAQVAEAVAQGATVAYDGGEATGNFLKPVILTDCTHEMGIARDETFGPVACVFRVADTADAIRLANDTPYGLGAVVYADPEIARGVARQLTAGMIGVNQGLSSAGSTPWVGANQSGYGFHSGRDGHRQFAQVRVVSEARRSA